ncbi:MULTISPECIES: hypothetical protein [Bacillaceae]|uniref:Uncharacterized protein n=1 Tax=Evansella alkalicola TaxID=745819 RepID=A0ABS6JTU8_9BACI|nr:MULTISPECIES: hypothetical protein [Bacillaceae]MBU9721840.1 hypothetical protein [Bacillus alkalicola]
MDTKKWISTSILVSIVASSSFILGTKDRREKAMMKWKSMKARVTKRKKEDYEKYYEMKLGHSDPHDIKDNSMIGEGALYSVNYYNQKRK